MADRIPFKILPDGKTIKFASEGEIGAENHVSADEMIDWITGQLGGEVTREPKVSDAQVTSTQTVGRKH